MSSMYIKRLKKIAHNSPPFLRLHQDLSQLRMKAYKLRLIIIIETWGVPAFTYVSSLSKSTNSILLFQMMKSRSQHYNLLSF